MRKSVLSMLGFSAVISLASADQSAIDTQGAVTNIQSPRNNSDVGIAKNDIQVNSFGQKLLLAQSDYERELLEQREREREREHEHYVRQCLIQCEQANMSCERTCTWSTGIDAKAYEQCNANCEGHKMTCEGMCQ